mgnify:CR=1 FL=1
MNRLSSLLGIALLALAWELAPRLGLINSSFFPPFSNVINKLFEISLTSEFWGFLVSTIRTWALGLTIASLGGIVVGLFIGLTPGVRRYTHSTIEFLRPIPSVALIPGVILFLARDINLGWC